MTNSAICPTIAVVICTYKRNEALKNLLDALVVSVAHVAGRARVGVVVVDDSTDGNRGSGSRTI